MTAALLLALLTGPSRAADRAAATYGILLLAHGGGQEWDLEVHKVRRELDGRVPTEVAFGMADSAQIQKAVDWLEARGVAKIVAVPLFIHSASEVLEHTRYVLGLREHPSQVLRDAMAQLPSDTSGHGAHGGHASFSSEARARVRAPLVMTPALDDHPLVSRILLERAQALSRQPDGETVVIVGHGPVDDKANRLWLRTLGRLAARLRREGRFKAASAATIRDDSPAAVKAAAIRRLRELVARSSRQGPVLVLPHLVAPGGIEDHIVEALENLDYRWDGRTLTPHPLVARWVAAMGEWGAPRQDMRRYGSP